MALNLRYITKVVGSFFQYALNMETARRPVGNSLCSTFVSSKTAPSQRKRQFCAKYSPLSSYLAHVCSRAILSKVFDEMIEVNLIDSADYIHLAFLKRPELGVTLTKLHCWTLTHYSKCVFLDADTLVKTSKTSSLHP
ncbi:hypothetical protein P7K49_039806 [Saguinus oedipus]|uniref:Hexosyltransferase n=1 Tax=Saguinus oedipus TaxID=9490 RepID=A0ABQ9TC93_SAGOE|nr:hypothetical protein P7K49_039806 [Saguinus oedipus]